MLRQPRAEGLAVLLSGEYESRELGAFRNRRTRETPPPSCWRFFTAAAGSLLWLSRPAGAVMVLAALLCLLGLRRTALIKFHGMSGDLAAGSADGGARHAGGSHYYGKGGSP